MAWTLRKLLRFPTESTMPVLAEAAIGFAQDARRTKISDGTQWRTLRDMLVFDGDQDYAPTATNRQVKAGWLIYRIAPTGDRTIDLSSTAWNEGAKVTVINLSTGGSDLLVSLGSVTHVVNPGEEWEATYFGGSWIVPSTLNGMRNKLINGDMRIDQRNAGASKTYTAGAGRAYGVDRWWVQCTGANMTGKRVAGSMSPYAYRLNGAINVTDVKFGQILEAENAAPLNNRIVTVSAILRADQQRTITWRAKRAGAADNWTSPVQLATGTIAVTTVPKRFTFRFAAGSYANLGIGIQFESGAFGSVAFLEIEEVQLEEGPVATPFERRMVGAELALCQRYYLTILGPLISGSIPRSDPVVVPTSNGRPPRIHVHFPVTMRTSPSYVGDTITTDPLCTWNPVTTVDGFSAFVTNSSGNPFYYFGAAGNGTARWDAEF